MTKTIYLARHCQASGQEPDAQLTEAGLRQAKLLAKALAKEPVTSIVSSPFTRAYQTALPLAELRNLTVETDERLAERVLCRTPVADWREKLAASFADLDLCLEGGESSRLAMERGMAAIADANTRGGAITVMVTHGNLMALLLKGFNDAIGFAEWQSMSSPDVYRIEYADGIAQVEHVTTA